jgi:hypothetical protein
VPQTEIDDKKGGVRSWKNPASDAVDGLQPRFSFFEDDDEEEDTIYSRPRNHMGVEIMPQIIEEDEEEGSVFDGPQKRLSKVKLILDKNNAN